MAERRFDPAVVGAELAETTLPGNTTDKAKSEELDIEKDARIEHQHELTEDIRHFRGLRERYARKAYWFMVVWCVGVALVVIAQGLGIWSFSLPVAALTTLIGGTTVSVVGLVGFILQGLFRKP